MIDLPEYYVVWNNKGPKGRKVRTILKLIYVKTERARIDKEYQKIS
jgi:hypothetical protein